MLKKSFGKILMGIFLITCPLSRASFAAMPNLRLPFSGGKSWYMTRGYNTETHKKYTIADDRFALDFADSGCAFVNDSIVATASGTISVAHNVDDNDFGKYVIISHGDGYTSKYSHLNSVTVFSGYVDRGQEIGKVGNTGNVTGSCGGAHLHFTLYHNNVGVKPEPMSGYIDFIAGVRYPSNNYPDSVSTTLVHPGGWNYEIGHAFENPVDLATSATVTYQNQEVSMADAVANKWIYRAAYTWNSYTNSYFPIDIRTGSFDSATPYVVYSYKAGCELTLSGKLTSMNRQAIQDMDSVAVRDSRFISDGFLYTFNSNPSWGTDWTLHWMAYDVYNGYTWIKQATKQSDNSVRYTSFRDPDNGQWTSWERIYY